MNLTDNLGTPSFDKLNKRYFLFVFYHDYVCYYTNKYTIRKTNKNLLFFF